MNVCQWKPDTCNCILLYDGDTREFKESNGKQKSIKCSMHQELNENDIVPFVIAENQASNKFYEVWTEKEVKENHKLIRQYKKVFIEVPTLEPIFGLNALDSQKALRG